jgi:uncharacterized protein
MRVPRHLQRQSKGANVKHEHASLSFKVKDLDGAGAGSFTGLLAAYNNIDFGNDLIEPGAFARTLNSRKTYPLLWQHDPSSPIGTLEVTDSPQGLMVKGQLLLDIPQAKTAYSLLKAKVISGLSIGYDTVKDSIEDGVRHLKELRLWEGSIVTFPMNQLATVTGVKALSDDDRAKHFKAIDEHLKAIGRHQRGVREHLKAMSDAFDDDGDDDEALILDEGDDEDTTKAFLVELQKLAESARELA